MSAPNGSNRIARRRSRQRSQVLATAAARFSEFGPHGVSLEQVAEAADLSRTTLVRHFPAKSALLEAIVQLPFDALAPRLDELKTGRPRRRVETLANLLLELWASYPRELLVAHEVAVRRLAPVGPAQQQFHDAVLALLSASAQAGILRGDEPAAATAMLLGAYVPLLQACASCTAGANLFRASLVGLLLIDRRK